MRSDEALGQFSQLELWGEGCPGLAALKNRVIGVRDSMKLEREMYLIG